MAKPKRPIFRPDDSGERIRATRIDEAVNHEIDYPPLATVDAIADPVQRESMHTSCVVFYETFCPMCADLGYLPLNITDGWSSLVGDYIGGIGGDYEWAMWQLGKLSEEAREHIAGEIAGVRGILGHLIGSGWIELITVDNWPALRPIGGWEDIAVYFPEGDEPDLKADAQAGNASLAYTEYLASPEWAAKRAVKLAEAGHRCQLCNGGGQLHVHHRTYERRGNEAMSDLTVLCKDCHELFHKSGRKVR